MLPRTSAGEAASEAAVATEVADPDAAAPSTPGESGAAARPKGETTHEKPRGPPLTDTEALEQLADIGNGCCVVTLRWAPARASLPPRGGCQGMLACAHCLRLGLQVRLARCTGNGISNGIVVVPGDAAVQIHAARGHRMRRDEEAAAVGLPTGGRVEGALAAAAPLALSCWRGRASLNILVAKPECATLADKLRLAVAAHAPSPVSALNPHAQVRHPDICGRLGRTQRLCRRQLRLSAASSGRPRTRACRSYSALLHVVKSGYGGGIMRVSLLRAILRGMPFEYKSTCDVEVGCRQ